MGVGTRGYTAAMATTEKHHDTGETMKSIGITLALLLASVAALAQDHQPSPLTSLGVEVHLHSQQTQETIISYLNTGDKEIVAAAFDVTYIDRLDRVTEVVSTPALDIHESGRRTLRPGKKNKVWLDLSYLHTDDRAVARATVVKFTDGTRWEAVKP
jgi:hypothetical protein